VRRLTAAEKYRANAPCRPVPIRRGNNFAYIAYDLDIVRKRSIANLVAPIIGNVFASSR